MNAKVVKRISIQQAHSVAQELRLYFLYMISSVHSSLKASNRYQVHTCIMSLNYQTNLPSKLIITRTQSSTAQSSTKSSSSNSKSQKNGIPHLYGKLRRLMDATIFKTSRLTFRIDQ